MKGPLFIVCTYEPKNVRFNGPDDKAIRAEKRIGDKVIILDMSIEPGNGRVDVAFLEPKPKEGWPNHGGWSAKWSDLQLCSVSTEDPRKQI